MIFLFRWFFLKQMRDLHWETYSEVIGCTIQPHLRNPIPFNARRTIILFHIHSHDLKIKAGTWQELDRVHCIGTLCPNWEIEVEEHLTFLSEAFMTTWQTFTPSIIAPINFTRLPWVGHTNPYLLGIYYVYSTYT